MTRVLPVLCLLACVAVCVPQSTIAQNPLPPDAKATCVVSPQDFASWFATGKVTPNGIVTFANSVGFTLDPKNPHCSFYQWSERMFLWLTSPLGGGQHVFDSSEFFDVATDGTLVPHLPGTTRTLMPRSAKTGVQGRRLAVAANGMISEIETGQAGGNGTLLAQNGSLVYYSTQINDVYAYFKTGSVANAFNPAITTFPTTQAQLNQIVAFAKTYGATLPDANALTMEIKTSWVEATSVNASQYVTMDANIPTYNFSAPPMNIPGSNPPVMGWAPMGTKKASLALIGMHVVGSVQNHPEMVWATFEHVNNAPNGPYSYTATDGSTKQIPQSTAGNWLFCANNAPAPYNVEALKSVIGGIVPIPSTAMKAVASNTVRSYAWGGQLGNAGVTDNTEIISINNSVLGQLAAGDIRKNYVLIGAVWTNGGIPPAQPSPPAPPVMVPANAMPIGSVMLSNATMETYHQASAQPFGMNCFSCHQGDPLTGLSHIWKNMKPLPPAKK